MNQAINQLIEYTRKYTPTHVELRLGALTLLTLFICAQVIISILKIFYFFLCFIFFLILLEPLLTTYKETLKTLEQQEEDPYSLVSTYVHILFGVMAERWKNIAKMAEKRVNNL